MFLQCMYLQLHICVGFHLLLGNFESEEACKLVDRLRLDNSGKGINGTPLMRAYCQMLVLMFSRIYF